MTPVKIDRLPNQIPRKEKYRQISDKKLAALKEHIDTLTKQGVIQELDEPTATHVSPVHIVFES